VNRAAWSIILGVAAAAPTAAAAAVTLFVIADTGDCRTSGAAEVSAAIRAQPDWQRGWLVEVGDLAYPTATPKKLAECHEPNFGMFAKRLAAPGNHDWDDHHERGFKGLFPQPLPRAAVLDSQWQLWLLDSELKGAAWRAQQNWLDAHVKRAGATCIIAAWHRPRWSSGWHGNDENMAPLWDRLAGVATFTLHGHDHHYEAIEALDESGQPDPHGTRSFVVGNGGAALFPPIRKSAHGHSVGGRWGFLRIDLDGRHYRWTEFAVEGEKLDSGSGRCLEPTSGR
jgi:acid phosphatase type 7